MYAICTNCKKEFFYSSKWNWYYGSRIVCSYHCMRDMRKNDEERTVVEMELEGMTYTRMTDAQRLDVEHMRKCGYSYAKIAEMTGINAETVRQYIKRHHIEIAGAAPDGEAADQNTEKETKTMVKLTAEDCPAIGANPQIDTAPAAIPAAADPIDQAETAVLKAKQAYAVDKARLISVLCDAVELLRRIYMEAEE